jgi:hypothetical protein
MAQTAVVAAPVRSLAHILAAPFQTIGRFLIALAEAGPRAQEIERLNAATDEELAARGKTREGEIRRIFGARLYI